MASRRALLGISDKPKEKKVESAAPKATVAAPKKVRRGGGGTSQPQNARQRIRSPKVTKKPTRSKFSGQGAARSISRGADPAKAAARLQARRDSVGDKRKGVPELRKQ